MKLYGLFDPENNLMAVHATEKGAEENKLKYEKQHGKGFYVDFVVIHE